MTWLEACLQYEGTKFEWCGRNDTALSCWGLICVAARDAGITDHLMHSPNYGQVWPKGLMDKWLSRYTKQRPAYNRLQRWEDQVHPGDLLTFHLNGALQSQHIAVYTGDRKFIHADCKRKKVIHEPMNMRFWPKRLYGIWHW